MADQEKTEYTVSPKILIGGDITYGLRATGDINSSSTDIDVISPNRKNIPQITISVGGYEDFETFLGAKEDNGAASGNNSTVLNPRNSVGAVGLDALFTPYTNSRSEDTPFLPHFEEPTSTEVGTSKTLDPFNPFNLIIEANTPCSSGDVWLNSGTNISYVLPGYNEFDSFWIEEYPNGDEAPIDLNPNKDFFSRGRTDISGVRAVSFRAPLVLSGWGYDTDGNPVPSSGGQLHPEANWNPNIWKTGPVDLRWDDARKVWTGGGGGTSAFYLCKVTNVYTPTSFSFEVDRSRTRDQYSRNAPTIRRTFDANSPIYDPEYVAYYNNPDNIGQYESLDYSSVEFPYYEAFIIRSTSDTVNSSSYYNIWTEDCNDCGSLQNPCSSSGSDTFGSHSGVSTAKKILIENPLRQALDAGDLCFTVSTGRSKNVNTGSFSGGSVSGVASGELIIDGNGSGYINVSNAGSGYTAGGFALVTGCDVCVDVTLFFEQSEPYGLASGTVDPSTGLNTTGTCPLQIIPTDATADTESLPIHWIMQSEFKSQQVVTHAECSAGILQTCTMKIQTQGFKSCEHCGEDTAFINAYS